MQPAQQRIFCSSPSVRPVKKFHRYLIFIHNTHTRWRCKRITLHVINTEAVRAKVVFPFEHLICLVALMVDLAQLFFQLLTALHAFCSSHFF